MSYPGQRRDLRQQQHPGACSTRLLAVHGRSKLNTADDNCGNVYVSGNYTREADDRGRERIVIESNIIKLDGGGTGSSV